MSGKILPHAGPSTRSQNDAENYYFGRDFLSSARLNLQHYLWREALGYYLHPRIPTGRSSFDAGSAVGSTADSRELRVAEIGTGTGIWLHSVALSLGSAARFSGVGFDIAADQFADTGLQPAGLTFRTLDATRPIPQDLRGTFDVVHLRLLAFVMSESGPSAFVRAAHDLLRPGGWIQWDEYDNPARRVEFYGKEREGAATEALLRRLVGARPTEWIARLDDTLRDSGFDEVELVRRRPPKFLLKSFSEMVLLSLLEHAAAEDRKAGGPAGGREVRELIDRSAEELRRGVVHSHLLQVVVGRKRAEAEDGQ